jgi:hypothetical protein
MTTVAVAVGLTVANTQDTALPTVAEQSPPVAVTPVM